MSAEASGQRTAPHSTAQRKLVVGYVRSEVEVAREGGAVRLVVNVNVVGECHVNMCLCRFGKSADSFEGKIWSICTMEKQVLPC
jgi:hypothetical protein